MPKKRKKVTAAIKKVIAAEERDIEIKGPQKVASGYYYRFNDRYKISNPQFKVDLTRMGRVLRLKGDLYMIRQNFIYDKIIGEKV